MAQRSCGIPGCGNTHRAKGLCSTHYNQRDSQRHRKAAMPCTVCQAEVLRPVTSDRLPACSPVCRATIQFGSHHGTGYSWSEDAARRARAAGASVIEIFDRFEIFERDGYRCQICGELAVIDGNPFDPLSATVDHIVPLSRGGSHCRTNAQCAHLACNSAKQDHLLTA